MFGVAIATTMIITSITLGVIPHLLLKLSSFLVLSSLSIIKIICMIMFFLIIVLFICM